MSKNARQCTIRNIPDRVDRALRRRAKAAGKSFNQVALEALASGADESLRPKRDFSEVIGSLAEKEAFRMDEEILNQRRIDPFSR